MTLTQYCLPTDSVSPRQQPMDPAPSLASTIHVVAEQPRKKGITMSDFKLETHVICTAGRSRHASSSHEAAKYSSDDESQRGGKENGRSKRKRPLSDDIKPGEKSSQ